MTMGERNQAQVMHKGGYRGEDPDFPRVDMNTLFILVDTYIRHTKAKGYQFLVLSS